MTLAGSPIRTIVLLAIALCALSFPLHLNAQAEKDIVTTARKLQMVAVADDQNLPNENVPPDARSLSVRFKHDLRDIVVARITHLSSKGTVAGLESAIVQELSADGIKLGTLLPDVASGIPKSDDARFGIIENVRIEVPVANPDLFAVVTTLEIPCGNDSSLYVFQRNGTRWSLVLAEEANNYAQISGAQGTFKYSISPPNRSGNWFVATASVTPWCTSAWRGIRVKVLRPGAAPGRPHVLLDKEESDYMGWNDLAKLRTDVDGFRVVFFGPQNLDPGYPRVHCLAYLIRDDNASRTVPFAFQAQDFLDEWFNLPWTEAALWTDSSAAESAAKWRAMIRGTPPQSFDTTLDTVQLCNGSAGKGEWIVGLDLGERNPLPSELFFRIREDGEKFYVSGIYEKNPAGCTGKRQPASDFIDQKLPD